MDSPRRLPPTSPMSSPRRTNNMTIGGMHPPSPMGMQVPSIGQTGSFTSMDTKRLARVGRHKATPEEEAQILSRATSQAMIAARSLLLSGATEATALSTAKAAASSILAPNSNSFAPYVSRRKAKQQANVIASMALMAAKNARSNSAMHSPDELADYSDVHSSLMFNLSPTNAALPRVSEQYGRPNGSQNQPPSVIRRDFREDDPSSIAGVSATGNESFSGSDDRKSARNMAISKKMELPTSAAAVSSSQSEKTDSNSWGKRRERSEVVAKLLMPLEDNDVLEGDRNDPELAMSQDKKDSHTMSYSSEGFNTLQSYSSDGSIQEKKLTAGNSMNPFSTLMSAMMCGASLNSQLSHEENFGAKDDHDHDHDHEDDDDDHHALSQDVLSEDTEQYREPYEKSRVHPIEEEKRASEEASSSRHSRKESETSLGNAEIVRALESFERERMGSSRSQATEMKSNNKMPESMEKLVLRALAMDEPKTTSPSPQLDPYQSPGKLDKGGVLSPRQNQHSMPSPRGMRWRRSRKSKSNRPDME